MPDPYMSGREVTIVSSSADSYRDPGLKIREGFMGNGTAGAISGHDAEGQTFDPAGESHRGNRRYTG
ncbi:MAG: hypothetical protein WA188_10440 [Terriglobales bacterium]